MGAVRKMGFTPTNTHGNLGAYELADRVCAVFGCPHYEHLSVAENVA